MNNRCFQYGVPATEKSSVYRNIRAQLDEPSNSSSAYRPLLSMEAEDEEADELSRYLSFAYSNITGDTFSLLDFWQLYETQFPQLYKIALKTLCIPATSCSPERGFSIMKRLIADDRSQLDPRTVSAIMIGRSLRDFDDI